MTTQDPDDSTATDSLGSPDHDRGGPTVDEAVDSAEAGSQVEGVHTPSGEAASGESRVEQMPDVAGSHRRRQGRRQSGRTGDAAETGTVTGRHRLRRCATDRRCAYLRPRRCRGTGARRATVRHRLRGQHRRLVGSRELSGRPVRPAQMRMSAERAASWTRRCRSVHTAAPRNPGRSLVARGRIELPTYRFSGGFDPFYTVH